MNAEVGPDGRAQFAEQPMHVPGKPELALAPQRHLQTELIPLAKLIATKEHFSFCV